MASEERRDVRYKNKDKKYETWEQTIKRNSDRLLELEEESISLLQTYGLNTDRLIVDTNSTGKDSMVKTFLANKAGLKFATDAIEQGWALSFPEWDSDIKDISDAVQRYGRLFTLKMIIDAMETNQVKLQVLARTHCE